MNHWFNAECEMSWNLATELSWLLSLLCIMYCVLVLQLPVSIRNDVLSSR